jgi:hypothetical protein
MGFRDQGVFLISLYLVGCSYADLCNSTSYGEVLTMCGVAFVRSKEGSTRAHLGIILKHSCATLATP